MATISTYPIRPYQLGADTDAIGVLEKRAFVEDYQRMGEDPSAQRHRARRVESILALLGRFLPSLRFAEMGNVIEQDGRIASVVLYSREGTKGNQWTIDAVGTDPDYQRRGMARQLIVRSLECIRANGGRICTLKVREDNAPAYRLYRDLGFEHYDTTHHLKRATDGSPLPAVTNGKPQGLREISTGEWYAAWRERLGLTHRSTTKEVRQFVPICVSRFKRPRIIRALAPMVMKIGGFSVRQWLVHQDGKLVATLRIRADRTGSRSHEIRLDVDPVYSSDVSGSLLDMALAALAPFQATNVLIETRESDAALSEALVSRGFRPMSVWHWLGIRLDARNIQAVVDRETV